jgi:hypothetical protein
MPALQLDRPDLRVALSQPVGQAPHRLLVRLDGVVGVAVGPQRQLPGDGEHGEVRMRHVDHYRNLEGYASSPRRHDSSICAAQQVRELAGVGDRLVPVAVV